MENYDILPNLSKRFIQAITSGSGPESTSSSSLPAAFILLRTAPATLSPASLLPYSAAAFLATTLNPVVLPLLCLPSSFSPRRELCDPPCLPPLGKDKLGSTPTPRVG